MEGRASNREISRKNPSPAHGAFRRRFQPTPIGRRSTGRHTAGMQDIYLVEDSSPVRERLAAMLTGIPNTRVVGHAGGAREAVHDILAKHPHVVLCDISLKDGTGFEVLRALRAKAPEIECYMLSNFATQPYRRLAAELGARDLFDKSTEFECVRDMVAKRAAIAA